MKTKSTLIASILLLGLQSSVAFAAAPNFYTGFQNLPASIHLYHYRGKAKRTMWFFTALPQLYIFNTDGREILSLKGGHDNLAKTLNRAFSKPVPIKGHKPLAQWMRKLTAIQSQAAPLSSSAQFTVLEYWATWCHYCYEERDQLSAYFRAHPDLTINWITVDTDKP
ncbi:MAG: TlpA family protein disulfide reductase [Gammaproteobacteria bacterium]